jgi:hypothetical protein
MRAKITAERGIVTLEYDDFLEGRVTREFFCPIDGGYVREIVGSDAKQVCERLSRTGGTLTASSRTSLIDVIRREYKAMKRADKN